MFPSSSLVLAASLWAVAVWGDPGQVTVDTVFNIHGSSVQGGCSADQKSTLNLWFDEAYDMMQSAGNALEEYETNIQVQQAVSTFFGIAPPDPGTNTRPQDVKDILQNIYLVTDFFNDLDGRQTGTRPHIFCDSTYMVPKRPNDPAKDKNGNTIKDSLKKGQAATIKKIYKKQLARKRKAVVKPFWIPSINAYEFGQSQWCDQFCSTPTNLAVTSVVQLDHEKPESKIEIMTLCSSAFTQSDHRDTLSNAGLQYGDHLSKWQPKSLTFLHESMHVVLGVEMYSGDKEIYGVERCAQKAITSPATVKKNPDSYAYFAMAMWYLEQNHCDFSSLVAQPLPPPPSGP